MEMPSGDLNEGHAAVARRAVECDATVYQLLAGVIDVVDLIGQVAKIPATVVGFGVPVIGDFDQRGLLRFSAGEVRWRAEKDEGESASLILITIGLDPARADRQKSSSVCSKLAARIMVCR